MVVKDSRGKMKQIARRMHNGGAGYYFMDDEQFDVMVDERRTNNKLPRQRG